MGIFGKDEDIEVEKENKPPHADFNKVRCIQDPYTTRYKLQECDYTGNWSDLPCKHFPAVKDALEYFHTVKAIRRKLPADIGRWDY